MTPARVRVGFVLEQTLGHVTHADNLRRLVPAHTAVDATFLPIEFDRPAMMTRVPVVRNWTLRAGLQMRRAVGAAHRRTPFDALFVHTQVPAVLNRGLLRRIPTVVSLDATPTQYDELGEMYGHARASDRVEALKLAANRRCFQAARHLVTWSRWTKEALVSDYGVEPDRITVVPPGVDPARWTRDRDARPPGDGVVRFLFVGGDLRRKGGDTLVDAFHALRDDPSLPPLELHLVTPSPVVAGPGVVVHSDLVPNSPELIDLYHRSDVFCLPTHADCLPMVLSEAGAAGLPLVATDVGAIREIVVEDRTGHLVAPGDPRALAERLRLLATDDARRRRLGDGAAALVDAEFDAAKNAARLVDVITRTAEDGR